MLKALAGVARAPFLLLPVTLVAAGAAAAAWDGTFSWTRTGVALIGLVAAHVVVNALNEVRDFETGIDLRTHRTPFSGGSGTLPSRALRPGAALALALVAAGVALVAGLWFLWVVGPELRPRLLAILALGALAVFAYTDVLARGYVGELFAGLGLGALPVVGTALVQGARPGPAALAVAVAAFSMTFNLLLLNEFPDEDADREGGRRNLVLLLGRRGAARLYVAFALLVPSSLVGAILLGALPLPALIAVLPSFLLGPAISWASTRSDEDVPLAALRANVLWNLATLSLLALSLVVAAW